MDPEQKSPLRPDLVLRIGLAGNREINRQHSAVRDALKDLFVVLGQRLAEIAPGTPVEGPVPRVAKYYSDKQPVLRLVTGLAEGADAMAWDVFDGVSLPHVSKERGAILPFDLATYRESRPEENRAEFDEHALRCDFILPLDGIYEKPVPDTSLARQRRARAYRAQSEYLLRHSDMIVVVADPDHESRAGGSLETIKAALAFDLPVIFVHAESGEVTLIDVGRSARESQASMTPADGRILPKKDWREVLREWVTGIVADPDFPEPEHSDGKSDNHASHSDVLLDEFLCTTNCPPFLKCESSGRDRTWREMLWTCVIKTFVPKGLRPSPAEAPLEPYATYRKRAVTLNYHYSGLYRGAFLLNYLLAVLAVCLAALSLVLIKDTFMPPDAHGHEGSKYVFWTLFGLALAKLLIVTFIFRNTHRANHQKWSDRAVAYRYLAERLRTMQILPRVGSFRPPAIAPVQFSERILRQSVVDWLFEAILRSVSPKLLALQENAVGPNGKSGAIHMLRVDVAALLPIIRDNWIGGQVAYHDRNARTMHRISEFAERWGKRMNYAVISAVLVDVALIVSELFHLLPAQLASNVHAATPWLIFLAAILPAAVAGLNGVRFQSECERLAERSAVIRAIMEGQGGIVGGRMAEATQLAVSFAAVQADPSRNNGAWTLEVLRLADRIAIDLVHEVTEWSVLYAKVLPEP